MDFRLDNEQELLRDGLARFLSARYDLAASRATARTGAGWQPDIWRSFADELGILGATLPADVGGSDGGAVELMVIAEELGRALVIEPYVGTVVVSGGLLRRAGGETAHALLERIGQADLTLSILTSVDALPEIAVLATELTEARIVIDHLGSPAPGMLDAPTYRSALTALSASASIVAIPEFLPRGFRATGLSLAYAVAVTVFGGTTQFIVTWLIGVTGNPAAPAWYVAGTSVLCAGAMMLVPETLGRPLED